MSYLSSACNENSEIYSSNSHYILTHLLDSRGDWSALEAFPDPLMKKSNKSTLLHFENSAYLLLAIHRPKFQVKQDHHPSQA